ncbi:MAG: tripartite tricarboxylate transporter substrate binding protein [Betaproteobacteria bacterium]|nr:tripartite tricarboxylate transporter substrate binding protein [Betaproteobacteria bacterium]
MRLDRQLALAALLAVPLTAVAPATAQNFPAKPVRMYTQFGPGTPGDVFARIFAASLGNILGQAVVIDSRPGGGGVLVASLATRAEPDGYTLVVLTATVPVSVALPSKTPLPFDPAKDLTPVAMVIEAASLLVASTSLGVNNLAELIDYAKKNPGKLSYGTTGIVSSHHLNGEQVDMLTDIKTVHIPYKTAPINDTAAGVLPLTYMIAAQAMPFIKSGKVRVLAMTTERRLKSLPDVPLMHELIPGFEPAPAWTGVYGPARLPQAVVRRLHTDINRSLSVPEVGDKIASVGFDVALSSSPEDFAARMKKGIDLTARIVRAAKIEPQ